MSKKELNKPTTTTIVILCRTIFRKYYYAEKIRNEILFECNDSAAKFHVEFF